MTVAKRHATPPANRSAASPARARTRKPADSSHPLPHDQLYGRILRVLRRAPNGVVELTPLAEELKMPPETVQLELERMARRGMVVLPFIEPGKAGGAELAQPGLEWLIAQEGGRPKDVPVALKPAKARVRAEDEAARLPRAKVYGVGR